MKNSLILIEINKIQREYKDLLESVQTKLTSGDFSIIIDEINVFWKAKKEILKLFLRYVSNNYNTYIFTGATFLDVEDKEQYPFCLLGDIHIVDDPLCRYAQVVVLDTADMSYDYFKEQIILTVKDNIKILNEYLEHIFILPIRLLAEMDGQSLIKSSNQVFFSLFNNKIESLKQYMQSYSNFEDIIADLKPGIENSLIFNEYEIEGASLQERFLRAFAETPMPKTIPNTEAGKFWFHIFGYLNQSLDIMLMCAEYNFIPYLRSNVTYHYLLVLSQNFRDINEFNEIISRCIIAHLLYNLFDKTWVENIDFNKFVSVKNTSNFNEELFEMIDISKLMNYELSIEVVNKTIKEHLEEFYSKMS